MAFTYLLLNVIFLACIVGLFSQHLPRVTQHKKAWLVTLGVLLLLTAAFDNIIIWAGIVDYSPLKILNLFVGNAPVEDFFYPLLAAFIVPALWYRIGKRNNPNRTKKNIHVPAFITTVKKLFWVSRPISWPNTAYPFAAGYLLTGGAIDLTFVIGTLYFLGPYNLLMYGINDVFDYESDIKNPRKGGVEGMREERAFHPTVTKAAIISNAPFLVFLLLAGGWAACITLVAIVFGVIAYSIKGLRFKEKPVIDSVTSSLHFVGPLVFALSLHSFPSYAWGFVVAFFVWGIASHAFGAVQDIVPDKKANIASIATFLGAKATMWFAILMYALAAFLIFLQGQAYIFIALIGLAYCINIAQYLAVKEKDAGTVNKAWKRFLWLNYVSGAVVTITIVATIYL